MKYSENDKRLLSQAGVYVEDKNYTKEEIESFKIKVTDYIMSNSSKEIDKLNKKFSNILYN